jgi:hypothetical protein
VGTALSCNEPICEAVSFDIDNSDWLSPRVSVASCWNRWADCDPPSDDEEEDDERCSLIGGMKGGEEASD